MRHLEDWPVKEWGIRKNKPINHHQCKNTIRAQHDPKHSLNPPAPLPPPIDCQSQPSPPRPAPWNRDEGGRPENRQRQSHRNGKAAEEWVASKPAAAPQQKDQMRWGRSELTSGAYGSLRGREIKRCSLPVAGVRGEPAPGGKLLDRGRDAGNGDTARCCLGFWRRPTPRSCSRGSDWGLIQSSVTQRSVLDCTQERRRSTVWVLPP